LNGLHGLTCIIPAAVNLPPYNPAAPVSFLGRFLGPMNLFP